MLKPIYGPHDVELLWNGKFGRAKVLRAPALNDIVEMSDVELTEWMSHSSRRTYVHGETGEVRIKLGSVFETPEAEVPEKNEPVIGDDGLVVIGSESSHPLVFDYVEIDGVPVRSRIIDVTQPPPEAEVEPIEIGKLLVTSDERHAPQTASLDDWQEWRDGAR